MKRSLFTKYYLAGAVSLVTFLVYLPALQNNFVDWDDNIYVYENPHIRSIDATFFRWAFSAFHAANWHPLTWISHALDYAIWGLEPMGHHLTNNILHAMNTFLVVLLVVRLLEAVHDSSASADPPLAGDSRLTIQDSQYTWIAAGTTGLFFGLHPLHVESVAWVAERKDLLCALFFLLSIVSYITYTTNRTYKNYLLTLAFFALALLSKPMAVSLPVVLLILDWYPFRRIWSLRTFLNTLFEKLPFIALSLISSILTILAQRAGGTMTMTEFVPLPARLLVGVKSLIAYLWKIGLPTGLSPYYPYPRNISFLSPEYFFIFILVLAITVICFIAIKKQPVWISVWAYYVITLIPVLGIIQVGGQAMADRYVYLPSLGPFFILGLGAATGYKKLETTEKQIPMVRLLSAVAALLLISMSYLTFRQIDVWQNDIKLWSSVIEKDQRGNSLAYYQRGVAFSKLGQFDKAMEDYNKTIAMEPYHYEVFVSRGETLFRMGNLDEAAGDFKTATTLKPFQYQAYDKLGLIYGKSGKLDEAIESFTRSIELNPGNTAAYVNRGYAYALKGEHGRSLEDYNKAVDLDPNSAQAYFNRGKLYMSIDNKERAITDMQRACMLGEEGGCETIRDPAFQKNMEQRR